MDRESKLAELRAKTDRQLVILIRIALDDGRASGVAAERAYAEARALLPTVRDLAEAERSRLESKLARLRGFLEERPVPLVGQDGILRGGCQPPLFAPR
jgi:hypothetical protein